MDEVCFALLIASVKLFHVLTIILSLEEIQREFRKLRPRCVCVCVCVRVRVCVLFFFPPAEGAGVLRNSTVQ